MDNMESVRKQIRLCQFLDAGNQDNSSFPSLSLQKTLSHECHLWELCPLKFKFIFRNRSHFANLKVDGRYITLGFETGPGGGLSLKGRGADGFRMFVRIADALGVEDVNAIIERLSLSAPAVTMFWNGVNFAVLGAHIAWMNQEALRIVEKEFSI